MREVITDRGKDQVIQALQYYDYDVERTIQAFLEGTANQMHPLIQGLGLEHF